MPDLTAGVGPDLTAGGGPDSTPGGATGLLGPRVIVAGTHSGVGKTTVATGIMAALARAGPGRRALQVAPAKVGPDFIDPGYHHLATGRPGRNLDVFMCGAPAIAPLAARAAAGADLLVVEGVMGLFDGVGSSSEASTAHVARLLEAPVILVVDVSAMSGSAAALVSGYDAHLRRESGQGLAGVVLNHLGSEGHEALVREALSGSGIPVLGALRRDDRLSWRDRHLGLIPVVEHPSAVRESLDRLVEVVEAGIDLAAVEAVARSAPVRSVRPLPSARSISPSPVPVAVVSGPAFSFSYPDNLERLAEAGAELVPFDPLTAPSLPRGVQGLYAGGGFPEVFVEGLAANRPLLADVRSQVGRGLVTWAECGGLLWLCQSLDGHPLSGVLPAEGRMTDRLTLGYRTARLLKEAAIGPEGTEVRGHEFHYSALDVPGEALALEGRGGVTHGGWASPRLFASYLHLHLGADPTPAEQFMARAAKPSPNPGPSL